MKSTLPATILSAHIASALDPRTAVIQTPRLLKTTPFMALRKWHRQAISLLVFTFLSWAPFLRVQATVLNFPLRNLEFGCCTIVEPPFVFPDETRPEGFGGIAIEYLQLLEVKLGFRCKSLDIYVDPNGGNSTFNDFIKQMETCTVDGKIRPNDPECVCDMGVGAWSLNDQRLGRVDFLQPFSLDYYRVMTHVNNTQSPIGDVFFFTAFETPVWICVFALIAMFAILKILDQNFAPEEEEENEPPNPSSSSLKRFGHVIVTNKTLARIQQAFRSIVAHMMGHNTPEVPGDTPRTRQWIVNVVIFLCGLFLVLTYEASMTAALVNETWTSKFTGLEDFKKCRIPANQVCVVLGSGVHTFWKAAVETRPCHHDEDRPEVQTYETLEETFRNFLAYKCKYMISLEVELEQILRGPSCRTVRLTGRRFREVGISFVLPWNSPLSTTMSNATLELRNADLIPSAEKFLSSEGICDVSTFQPVTFIKLIWFFVLVFIAIGVMFILIAASTLAQRRCRRTGQAVE